MITGKMFRDGIISGSNNISNSRQAVDALNIFPFRRRYGHQYEHDNRRSCQGNGCAAG